MLLGKRPRPPVMRRTTSMSGGMAVDMQVSDLEPHEEVMMPDNNNTLNLQQGEDGDGDGDGDDGIKDPPHHAVPMGHDHGLMLLVPDNQAKNNVFGSIEYQYDDERLLGMVVSPNSHMTTNITHHHSQNQASNNPPPPHHVIHTPHFLRTCGLCKCRLAPGRDIYMYRGDTAFCSLECREEQMKQDSRKEKWKMASNKEDRRASPRTATATATAKASTKSKAAACT